MNEGSNRVDLYAAVHKGLRACMAHVLVEVGQMDTTDGYDTTRALESVRHLVKMCRSHLEHEDIFVHGAMQARRPGSEAATRADHAQHVRDFVALEDAVAAVESSSGEAKRHGAHRLYGLLARFVAENYEHMHVEETHNNAILWAEYTDAELLAIKGRIIASVGPEMNMAFLRWMGPSISPAERAELFAGARATMPAAAFDAGLALVKNHLSARDWFKLQMALAPEPGAAYA
jgi:hypothetical protein